MLACYNPDDEEYQSICKIGTGFTDENLEKVNFCQNSCFEIFQFTAQLKPLVCPKKAYYQFGSLVCDVYFEPEIVWEIKCADLSISPAHMAACGLVDEVKVKFVFLREYQFYFFVENGDRYTKSDSCILV